MMMLHNNKPLKILILISYFNRPIFVRNALNSILESDKKHKNWVAAFGDDGSEVPGEPIVREILKDHLDKVSFYNTNQTIEEKIKNGITIGKIANHVLSNTDADICITLCDDDELEKDYLWNLNRYFLKNKEVKYCWSNINLYNPFHESSSDVNNITGVYNKTKEPLEPYGKLDGSQVAFRVSALKEGNIWYRETTKSSKSDEKPWSYNLDGELFKSLTRLYGKCPYTGFVSQYKGVHEMQLVFKKEHVFKNNGDILEYHEDVLRKVGKEF